MLFRKGPELADMQITDFFKMVSIDRKGDNESKQAGAVKQCPEENRPVVESLFSKHTKTNA
jgi:hypothetical protein